MQYKGMTLVAAVPGSDDDGGITMELGLYVFSNAEKAQRFCDLYDERELQTAKQFGGHPGFARIISEDDFQSGTGWLEKWEREAA